MDIQFNETKMKTYNFTKGKKPIKTFREISNKVQGIYVQNESIRVFQTDIISEHKNFHYDTRFEEVK